jgi:Undecaprenyl-phosphate galactose phosphotransferase WbaP
MSVSNPENAFLRSSTPQHGSIRPAASRIRLHLPNIVCSVSLLAADILAIAAAATAALFVIWVIQRVGLEPGIAPIGAAPLRAAIPELSGVGGCILIYLIFHGHYTKRAPFWTEFQNVVEISLFALLMTSFMEFAFRGDNSRQLLVGTWILFVATAMGIRIAVKNVLLVVGLWQIKVLVISDSDEASESHNILELERLLGYRIVSLVAMDQIPTIRQRQYFSGLLDSRGARHLVLSINVTLKTSERVLKDVLRERVAFSLIPQLQGVPVFGFDKLAFFSHDTIMLSYRNNLSQPLSRARKTAFDIIFSAFLVILLAPPMAIIALLVKLDGGPVLFRHERVGLHGRDFPCLKFRTMATDAEAVLHDLLARDPDARREWYDSQKLTKDPRITRIGRLLRSTSLDELPQLFNVLRLEMSLVGPRPIVRQEIQRYEDDIAYYYDTKPGLTGLWQVSGRSDITYKTRVKLDCWYVRNWSMWQDIAIILKTVPAVIGRHGAR